MNAFHPVAPDSYPVEGEPVKKPALQGARQPADNGLGGRDDLSPVVPPVQVIRDRW